MKLMSSFALAALILILVLSAGVATPAAAGFEPPAPLDAAEPGAALRARFLADQEPAQALASAAVTPCVSGMAGVYPCSNVVLSAFLPNSTIGGGSGSSCPMATTSGTIGRCATCGDLSRILAIFLA